MKKISIKREQSQAGLSFAEREKFRPQVKNKLLLLLALLLTAATGAWADGTYTIKFEANGNSKTVENVTLPHTFSCDYSGENGELDQIIKQLYGLSGGCCAINSLGASGNSNVTAGLNGQNQFITISAPFEGNATVTGMYFDANYSDFNYSLTISCPGYDPNAGGYSVTLKDGVKDADKWTVKVGEGQAQALPIGGLTGLSEGDQVTIQYTGRLKVKGVKATSDAAAAGNSVDLSTLAADYEAQNGDVLTGETSTYKVTIAAGATVTLDGVNISSSLYCIKCAGDATIILKDGSTNTLTGTGNSYPALSIGDANTTLTIQGSTGVLNVTSGNFCAGIGGGYKNTDKTCGNIRIEGGVITAQGGNNGSGIGSDNAKATCGDIIITGGTITAKGGNYAAGIGTGKSSSNPAVCGDITIANTVTKVTATKGADAPYSIGKGNGDKASCGTVTIGSTKYWENNAAVNGGDTYLATSPYTYQPSN